MASKKKLDMKSFKNKATVLKERIIIIVKIHKMEALIKEIKVLMSF